MPRKTICPFPSRSHGRLGGHGTVTVSWFQAVSLHQAVISTGGAAKVQVCACTTPKGAWQFLQAHLILEGHSNPLYIVQLPPSCKLEYPACISCRTREKRLYLLVLFLSALMVSLWISVWYGGMFFHWCWGRAGAEGKTVWKADATPSPSTRAQGTFDLVLYCIY